MERTFKIITSLIICVLVLSSTLHIILLSSDSEIYRLWVITQIGVQVIGSILQVFVYRFSLSALIVFFVLSIVFVLINALKVNYGHILLNAVMFLFFWAVFGGLTYVNRNKFMQVDQAK